MRIVGNNSEREEAEEILEIDYQGPAVQFSVNALYVIEVLAVLPPGAINLFFSDGDSSILIDAAERPESLFVIMPIRY